MIMAYCWYCNCTREMEQVDDVLLCNACGDAKAEQCAKCGHVFANFDEYDNSHLHEMRTRERLDDYLYYCPECCPKCNAEEVKR
jgi:hypothetical protein